MVQLPCSDFGIPRQLVTSCHVARSRFATSEVHCVPVVEALTATPLVGEARRPLPGVFAVPRARGAPLPRCQNFLMRSNHETGMQKFECWLAPVATDRLGLSLAVLG